VPEWYSHTEVCDYLMERCVAIHLDSPGEKFSMVGVMLKKLLTFVQKKCVVEGADSLMMHEIVLGGHLYLQLIKVLFFSSSLMKRSGYSPFFT
jgi:DNA-directed RNA polymerase I subunit RPA2